MTERNFVSDAGVQSATETTKTLSATITVPQGVSKLVEIGQQIIPNGAVTDDEDYSAILELESDDATGWGGTQAFASDVLVKKTSGATIIPARVHDCNIAVSPGSHIKASSTFNKALTTTPSVRVFGKFI